MRKIQGDIITDLLKRFPDAASKTIATKAFKENPKCFTSVDGARSAVRHYRGALGVKNRNSLTDRSHVRPLGKSGVGSFDSLPQGLTHFKDWGAIKFDGPLKVGLLADLHIPYHDLAAVTIALEHCRKAEVDTILLNGDIADCFAVSFWEKDPRKRDFSSEVTKVKAFLSILRNVFGPNVRILYKIGNHEERWERYMSVKAPELLNIEEFDLKNILGLDKLNIQMIGDKRPIMLGKLNVIHGHEFNNGGMVSNPVNPARGYFLRGSGVHCIGSHYHQSSQHSQKNLEQNVTSTWSTGCLCDLHPDYRPANSWNHGFAIVTVEHGGVFQVDNFRIIDGKVY